MIIALAILRDVFEFVAEHTDALFGGVGATVTAIVGWIGARYLNPLLKIGKRKQYAQWIAALADDIIDALTAKYPNQRWLDKLDEASEELARAAGVSPEISRRALRAALARRGRHA